MIKDRICSGAQLMLNLTVAMNTKRVLYLLVVGLLFSYGMALPVNLVIGSPQKGDVVQGVVEIKGTVASDTFRSAEVYYAYGASGDNWFLIAHLDQPVENALIARWDTTTITDGEYQLKVRLLHQDGSFDEFVVNPIHVRNYSAEPTVTPAPTSEDSLVTETAAPTRQAQSYATALPANPASTSAGGIRFSLAAGIILAILALLGLLLYSIITGKRHLG